MKFKILLQAFLLLQLLTPTGYAQTRPELPDAQSNVYGIGPEQFYPGTLVLELMEAAEEEIDSAAVEAFAEGYKAAALRYAPDLAALEVREYALKADIERERKRNRFFWPAAGVSFAIGFFVHFLISR